MNKHIHLLWSSVYSYAQRIALLDKAIQLSGKRWPVCHRDCVSFYSWICRMACCTCTVCCFVLFYCCAMHYTYKQIWLINFPVMMSILMEQLINITDAVFLGHVGEVELGASAIAGIYYLAVYMLGFGFSIGLQVMIARRNGECDYGKAGRSENSWCDRQRGIFTLRKTFFRRNTDVFQGKMTRRTAKRPAVRVRWEFSDTP